MRKRRHERILGLPADVLAKINAGLTGGRSATSLASWLHKQGHMTDVSAESLSRELRKYRRHELDEKAAARQLSIQKSNSPRTQARLLERLEDYDVAVNWLRNLQRQESRVDKWHKAGAANMPSTAVRADIDLLHKMHKDFTTFMMDCGLIERAATQVTIDARHVVINAANFDVLYQALLNFVFEHGDEVGLHARQSLQRIQTRRVVGNIMDILDAPDEPLLLECDPDE